MNKEKDNKNENLNKENKSNSTQKELDDAKALIVELKKQIEQKNKLLNEFNQKVNDLNEQFIKKVNEKSQEAQKILDQRIKEVNLKFEQKISEIKKYAIKDNILDLLKILNQYNMALNQKNDDPKINNFLSGFKMFQSLFKRWLNDINVKEIEVKIGDEFNPDTMEAVDIDNHSELKENHVTKVLENGFKLHDRMIVHAKVVVAKHQQKN